MNRIIEVFSNWDKSSLNKFTAENESDMDYFPTTGSRVSKAKFHSSTDGDKYELIDDQLQLISLLYFNTNPQLRFVKMTLHIAIIIVTVFD